MRELTGTEVIYDVFVAHAHADIASARELYAFLVPHLNVFLDEVTLQPGDDWTDRAQAQRNSRITVVLVSRNTERAYYLREEIANAIKMNDTRPHAHRIIPVYLDGVPSDPKEIPYGLMILTGIDLREEGGMKGVARRLKEAVDRLRTSVRDEPFVALSTTDSNVRLLRSFVDSEKQNVASIKLPLPSNEGFAVVLPLDRFRADLPLRRVYDHSRQLAESVRPQSDPGPSIGDAHVGLSPHQVSSQGADLEMRFDRQRRNHTELLSAERATRATSTAYDWDLTQALKPGSRFVVFGDSGSGKSTLLRWITHHYATISLGESPSPPGGEVQLPAIDLVPVLIVCRDIAGALPVGRLGELFELHLRAKQFVGSDPSTLARHLERSMEAGRVVLLIDGVDEILELSRRVQFCRLLRQVAIHFRNAPIIVTSRVAGLLDVRTALSECFDFVEIGPLEARTKIAVAEGLARLNHLDADRTLDLVNKVCHHRSSKLLTNNLMMLAMVAQLHIAQLAVSGRRIDIFRQALRLLTQWRKEIVPDAYDSSAVIAYLEYLAYRMRKVDRQRYADSAVVGLFSELKKRNANEPTLAAIEPGELLERCIHVFGILNVAGFEIDPRGLERQSIQFIHQSFQEYLAGQAIKHGWDSAPEQGVVARLRELFESLVLEEREVAMSANERIIEWVIVGSRQEMIRSAIADLETSEADDAIQMMLPDGNAPAAEARARAVFAMLCLAEGPRVGSESAALVFDAAVDALVDEDGMNGNVNTSMDEALVALSATSFVEPLRKRLIEAFIECRGRERLRAGRCLLTASSQRDVALTEESANELLREAIARLRSTSRAERVGAAIYLMNLFYRSNGKLDFLPGTLRDDVMDALEMLLDAPEDDDASRCAAIWALAWMTNSIYRGLGPNGDDKSLRLRPSAASKIRTCIEAAQLGCAFVAIGGATLTREQSLHLICHQRDWMYDLAAVADGDKPRRDLAIPAVSGSGEATVALLTAELRACTGVDASRIALALGSLGEFNPSMVGPLQAVFLNRGASNNHRDEALVYLALIGSAEAARVLEEAHATAPSGKDDYLFTRGLFGLLLLDDVDILARHLLEAREHYDLKALARGLLGSRDPRGCELVRELWPDANDRVRGAMVAALKASWAPKDLVPLTPEVELARASSTAEQTVCILLVRGQDPDGTPIFAYVAVRADRLTEFMQAQQSGLFYPEDFGVIVESGRGEPSDTVRNKMTTEFGFNHEAMVDMQDAAQAQRLVETLAPEGES